MGVPKFYRWLSERYPCLSQTIKEHQIPEFDNLYLDMNGIIHPCSHPNDDDPSFRITETEIFQNIFNYIEVLFRIIKPQRNFFMAVDGCAPRAKMNQQRGRRFKTAKEAEDNIRKALLKGQELPSEERFDSNCITPGTEFMARLQLQLKYFANKKISTDPLWQNVNVYLSGHDVPGEGEHKVMDFIRYCKAMPDYDPNTRHCLYGLDADLVYLGMTTHEPHFALLREEIIYSKSAKRITKPEEQTFHLLHLSLLREYVNFEFQGLKNEISFKYDSERIIDDWVFLGFLVGNDFVPHLPHMHINQDALSYLYSVYKKVLPTLDGYLHDGGYIDLPRMKIFLTELAQFDRARFDDVYDDMKWLQSKGTGKMLQENGDKEVSPTKSKKKFSQYMREHPDLQEPATPPRNPLADVSGLEDFAMIDLPETPVMQGAIAASLLDRAETEEDERETYELEFKQHKRDYYMQKFEKDLIEDSFVEKIAYEYLLALQWILHYYFNGLQSWSWYYPAHFSPFVSDVAALSITELTYDIAQPFHPFEQLLAVLPAASKKLLPDAFQTLMTNDNSLIIDYYPTEFRTDLNGKQQEWEAVVLIPFIDETRLLAAMQPFYAGLTDEEKGRNAFGCSFCYRYDPELNFAYPSSLPDVFEDIAKCQVLCEEVHKDAHRMDVSRLRKGLMKGTKLDIYFPGFPTMKNIPHEAHFEKAGVRVFQQNSRNDNCIVTILPSKTSHDPEKISKQLLGQVVHVEWPYLVEALVVSVMNDKARYTLEESKLLQGEAHEEAKGRMKDLKRFLMDKKGIQPGETDIVIEAKPLLGKRYICGQKGKVSLEPEWAPAEQSYLFQTVVSNIAVESAKKEVFDSIEKLFPVGSSAFMLAAPHYGCGGEVYEVDTATGRIRVGLKVPSEPDFSEIISEYDQLTVMYFTDHNVAQKLGISKQMLGKVTGDIWVKEAAESDSYQKGINIGLKLKYSGQNKEILGFARRTERGWSYSHAAIKVLNAYIEKYPEVFQALEDTGYDEYYFPKMFPGKKISFLDEIREFLKSQPCHSAQTVRCGSHSLDEPVVRKIENAVNNMRGEKKLVKVKVKPFLLFRPTDQFGKLSPDPDTDFLILDRVVNVQSGCTVPMGLRGTIIGVHQVLVDETDKHGPTETRYEVLFDKTFMGAAEMRSEEKRGYFIGGNSLINLSYGERKDNEKKGTPVSDKAEFKSLITQNPGKSPMGKGNNRTPGKGGTTPRNNSRHESPMDSANRNERTPIDRTPEPAWLKKQPQYSRESYSAGSSGNKSNRAVNKQSTPVSHNPQNTTSTTPKSSMYQGATVACDSSENTNNEFMNTWQGMASLNYKNNTTPLNTRNSAALKGPQPLFENQDVTSPQSVNPVVTQLFNTAAANSQKPSTSHESAQEMKVNQDATAALQKLLQINQKCAQSEFAVSQPPQDMVPVVPSQGAMSASPQMSPHAYPQSQIQPQPRYAPQQPQSLHQPQQPQPQQPVQPVHHLRQSKSTPGYPISVSGQPLVYPGNTSPISPSQQMLPGRQMTPGQRILFAPPQAVPGQPPQTMMQNPANNPSGHQPPPTVLLQNYCARMGLPIPGYMYTNHSPQGISSTVMIGMAIKIGGPVCNHKQKAADSAAANALGHLQQMYSAAPVQFMPVRPMQGMSSMPPGFPTTNAGSIATATAHTQIAQGIPTSMSTNTHPHQSSSIQQAVEHNSAGKQKVQASAQTTAVSSQPNPFIPHQVLMKNTSPQKDATATLPSVMPSPRSTEDETMTVNQDASDQLKGMLGLTLGNDTNDNTAGFNNTSAFGNTTAFNNTTVFAAASSVEADQQNFMVAPATATAAAPLLIDNAVGVGAVKKTEMARQSSKDDSNQLQEKPRRLLAPSFFGPKKK